MEGKNDYKIYLGKKIAEKHIDKIVSDFFDHFSTVSTSNGKIIFDFSDVDWISNQEILVITSLLKYLVLSNVKFKVNFLKNGSTEKLYNNRNKAIQLVQLWEIWKIGQVIPNQKYDEYFDITTFTIRSLKEYHNISLTSQLIYDKYGITPFISLNKIDNYEDNSIIEMLESVYKLNQATNDIIKKYHCELPFKTKTLSYIITKELYENFLDHFKSSVFSSKSHYAFMSLSLVAKFDEKNYSDEQIQSFISRNLREESLPEFMPFYFNKTSKKYRNLSFLQLSFLDFGDGIPITLKEQFKKKFSDKLIGDEKIDDNEILSYAFNYSSSRIPLETRYLKKAIIPRGLFDLLTIVKRFNGLLVVRSNYGRLFFNFSNDNEQNNSAKYFGNNEYFFPGTLISIYIPERVSEKRIDSSVIKPDLGRYSFKRPNTKRISLLDIQRKIRQSKFEKETFYERFFELFYREMLSSGENTIVYIDFEGYDFNEGLTKKLIFFLLTDYNINLNNSVIILNPPPKEFLDNIKNEINFLSEIVKQFYIHPTPFIFYDFVTNDITIYWLGISSNNDIAKLNDLLSDIHDLRKSDFENPDEIIGNLNYYDTYGNLKSLMQRENIINVLGKEFIETKKATLFSIIEPYIKREQNRIFLNAGNYYQSEYINMHDALSDLDICKYLSESLLKKISHKHNEIIKYKFISITFSSHKILSRLIENKHIAESQAIYLDNYHTFFNEGNFAKIKKDDNVILICDIISTGYLSMQLESKLKSIGAKLLQIAAIINSIDTTFEPEKINYDRVVTMLTCLWDYQIKKFRRKDILEHVVNGQLKIVRIDPFTNSQITNRRDDLHQLSILLKNEDFINLLEPEDLKIGYFVFNNLIHPYFFDMDKILSDKVKRERIISSVFEKLSEEILDGIEMIFYPKNSGIRKVDFNYFKNQILKNQGIKIIELDRFSTTEGWKFTQPASYLHDYAKNKKVLILDDGSCSGESIIQMIDEVTNLKVSEIIAISFISRVNDHKRDFFSKIKMIANDIEEIKIKVFFGSHWHIPTYFIEESPIIREKKWLEELLEISNLPFRIKRITENILNELSLKNTLEPGSRYLLKGLNGVSIAKEILLMKEKLGRVTSFKFYKEDFEYFDNLILDFDKEDRHYKKNKDVELICAVFLHEPELFEKVRDILPDLVELIEDFLVNLFFKIKSSVHDPNILFYEWDAKNLFHLFFIVFKDDKLFETLTTYNLKRVINRICKKESDLAYFLYKLLRYVPIDKEEVARKRFGGNVKYLIETILEDLPHDQNFITQLRIFSSFIHTLPFDQLDFSSHFSKIKKNYTKVEDDKFHNEYILNDKQILVNQLTVLQKKIISEENYENEILSIRNAWKGISTFIEELIKFSTTYPGFFLPLNEKMSDNYNNIVYLRSAHADIRDMIYSNKFSDIPRIKYLIEYLFENFISPGSKYPEIFANISTPHLLEIFSDFVVDLKDIYKGIILNIKWPPNITISIPKIFFTEIVLKEIKKNIRFADLSREIELEWKESDRAINLRIANFIKKDKIIKGGGKGLDKLYKLNDFPIKISYRKSSQKSTYLQNFSFTKI